MEISYGWMYGRMTIDNCYYEKLIDECSLLYSSQYGKWSRSAPYRAGQNIKLSPDRIRQWLDNDNASIYFAKDGDELVGYAIAIQLSIPKYGIISWVTQLVVHEQYRHKDIAKNLLHSIWGFTDNFAWGIVSANPYAIRALEKTTRRRSDPVRIKHNLRKILSIGIQNLPYINEHTEAFVTNEVSRINTEFFVDHSDVEQMIENVVSDTVPWKLGTLNEGWEWLAFTFNDQLPFELTNQEIAKMLDASDSVARYAYKRMDINSDHKWANHTQSEVDFIVEEFKLKSGCKIYDFGCGQGRHSLELASRGFSVVGIDYIDKNVEVANRAKDKRKLENVSFIIGDCRNITIPDKAQAIICLYDVVGSYASNDDNIAILRNIVNHLEENGTALISVMNYELTISKAKNTFTLHENPNALLTLKPGNIMESTGDVFDPNYYLVDTDTKVVYRREQFRRGKALPHELIVRDKRFSQSEIIKMCEQVGLCVEYSRFVSAKNWRIPLSATDESAKEILLKCKKKK